MDSSIQKRNNMKDFVLYPEAIELKQLGFDEPCFGWFASDRTLVKEVTEKTDFTLAPTYSQAFRWFREKYNINTVISWRDDLLNFDISLTEMKKHGYFYYKDNFTTYEEAELACLQHLIKIVKEQQK
jgi:hypothetical protein